MILLHLGGKTVDAMVGKVLQTGQWCGDGIGADIMSSVAII